MKLVRAYLNQEELSKDGSPTITPRQEEVLNTVFPAARATSGRSLRLPSHRPGELTLGWCVSVMGCIVDSSLGKFRRVLAMGMLAACLKVWGNTCIARPDRTRMSEEEVAVRVEHDSFEAGTSILEASHLLIHEIRRICPAGAPVAAPPRARGGRGPRSPTAPAAPEDANPEPRAGAPRRAISTGASRKRERSAETAVSRARSRVGPTLRTRTQVQQRRGDAGARGPPSGRPAAASTSYTRRSRSGSPAESPLPANKRSKPETADAPSGRSSQVKVRV